MKLTITTEPILLDAASAATLLGLGRSTFLRYDSAGRVPMAVRIGGVVRWRTDELRDWIRAGCPSRDGWTWPEGGDRHE